MNLIQQTIALPQVYTVPEDQIARRDMMVAEADKITAVTNQQEMEAATRMGVELQKHIKQVIEARKSLSNPLDLAKTRLIGLEQEYTGILLGKKAQLGRLVSAYQTAEAERVEREERERQEQFQQHERDRAKFEQQAAQEAPGSAQAIRLEQKAADAMEAATQVLTMPPVEVSKAKGAATRKELRWEVTDEAALYQAAPHLFSKPELKASAVKSCCNVGTKLDGIRFWEEDKTSFRA